jgi:hypothetical protein
VRLKKHLIKRFFGALELELGCAPASLFLGTRLSPRERSRWSSSGMAEDRLQSGPARPQTSIVTVMGSRCASIAYQSSALLLSAAIALWIVVMPIGRFTVSVSREELRLLTYQRHTRFSPFGRFGSHSGHRVPSLPLTILPSQVTTAASCTRRHGLV